VTTISESSPSNPASSSLLVEQAAQSKRVAREQIVKMDKIMRPARRAVDWLLAMQNRDGGWGAFDKDNDAEFLCHVPFADHNAMIDPSTPDLTGRMLEGLAQSGIVKGHPAVEKALAYLRSTQEADGSWYGRWGVNYIYGTRQVLVGLCAAGVPASDPAVRRGVDWLLNCQQADGAWGESADSYADRSLSGQGPATASQTAWALLGLIAAGEGSHAAVERGIGWLARTQRHNGTWDEAEFTGTGFPQVFYLRYHLYPHYFPMLALAAFGRHRESGSRH
jgi:squalene-hopene/tetraprenyl-beta-curcumene cyclase